MPRRTTLKDIAAKTRLSLSAVSLALRKPGALPSATVARVQRVAQDLDYRPDPGLSALAAYRSRLRVRREFGVIALVSNWQSALASELAYTCEAKSNDHGGFPATVLIFFGALHCCSKVCLAAPLKTATLRLIWRRVRQTPAQVFITVPPAPRCAGAAAPVAFLPEPASS